ncbi:hypothetical protein HIM_01373 [Hirsutella minnesotensis 3608]|nr:hypothetical protein HIM_01373 [Hirsutella minnesotensis 3608]
MASPNPVPSRAALHALRGVILTTSCSVILLAEERRRRLKIARAAIDNARKLHTVRHVRGSLVAVDALDPCSGGLAQVGETGLSSSSLPKPRTSTRRRRRHAHATFSTSASSNASAGAELSVAPEVTYVAEQRTPIAPPSHPFGLQSWMSDLLDVGASVRHGSRVPPKLMSRNLVPKMPFIKPPPTRVSRLTRLSSTPNELGEKHPEQEAANIWTRRDHVSQNEEEAYEKEESSQLLRTMSAIDVLAAKPLSAEPRAFCEEAYITLQKLHIELKSRRLEEQLILKGLKSAAVLLKSLASRGRAASSAKILDFSGVDLLKMALEYDREQATAITRSLLRLNRNPHKVLLALAEFMQHSGCKSYLADALSFLSDIKRRHRWMHGMQIHQVLAQREGPRENFAETKMLYQAMLEAGLFQLSDLSSAAQRQIRSSMALRGSAAGDDALAQSESKALQALVPPGKQLDVEEQCKVIISKAVAGQWNSVYADLEDIQKRSGTRCGALQDVVIRITDIFAQRHTSQELEGFLRRLVPQFGMKLRRRWVYLVFDGFCSQRQDESAFAWLRFCSMHGLSLDQDFCHQFYHRCRKIWCYSDASVVKLEERINNLQTIANGRHDDVIVDKNSKEQQEASYTKPSDPETMDGLRSMTDLRSAVVELLNAEKSGIERAISIVDHAHKQGLNVSEALTPLLLARLKRGDEPTSLVDEALHMGARVHDSVYNKAAQALATKGDLGGAVEMCECAARENGRGHLGYNRYNFANLLFAYTGSWRYDALQLLLSDFTSDSLWWKGGRVCKESIKLAMKTTAMRVVVSSEQSADVRRKAHHKQVLLDLDAALLHVKRCRSDQFARRSVSDTLVDVVAKSHDAREERAAVREAIEPVCMANASHISP